MPVCTDSLQAWFLSSTRSVTVHEFVLEDTIFTDSAHAVSLLRQVYLDAMWQLIWTDIIGEVYNLIPHCLTYFHGGAATSLIYLVPRGFFPKAMLKAFFYILISLRVCPKWARD